MDETPVPQGRHGAGSLGVGSPTIRTLFVRDPSRSVPDRDEEDRDPLPTPGVGSIGVSTSGGGGGWKTSQDPTVRRRPTMGEVSGGEEKVQGTRVCLSAPVEEIRKRSLRRNL